MTFRDFVMDLSFNSGIQDMSECERSNIETNIYSTRLYACYKTFWARRCISISLPLHAIHEVDLFAAGYCVWHVARAPERVSQNFGAYNILLAGPTCFVLLKFLRSFGCSSVTPYPSCAFLRRFINNASYAPGLH